VGKLDWKFQLQGEQASRLSNLQKPLQFVEIAIQVPEAMTVLSCHRDNSRTVGSKATRVVYCIQ
jgi:hypothetical protein